MLSKLLKMGGIGGTTCYFLNEKKKKKPQCCGIMGYIGLEDNAWEVLAQGINLLSNRGYDSVGISTIQSGDLKFDKIANTPG